MNKIITSSLSPNFEKDDISLIFKNILAFWKWKRGDNIKELELSFSKENGLGKCYSFNSGRSCLIAILKLLKIKKGDEIIVQGFTCNAVINPIIKIGAKPVFVDIKADLNINEKKIQSAISSKTKAIIVQHTFGLPAEIEEIKDICKDNNLYLIEDCAHSLGAKYNNKYCGSFGDVSFYSFGRDKIISSVFGGMLGLNNKDLEKEMDKIYENFEYPSYFWILSQLLYPIVMEYIFLPLFKFRLGRIFYSVMFELNIFSLRSVVKKENQGVMPIYFGKRLPNILALLALNQFKKLDKFNKHRKKIAQEYFKEFKNSLIKTVYNNDFYKKEPIFLKFPILTNNSDVILKNLRKQNMFLNDGWRETIVVPPLTDQKKMRYIKGSCIMGEKISKEILSLPTHIKISLEDARKIASIIKK